MSNHIPSLVPMQALGGTLVRGYHIPFPPGHCCAFGSCDLDFCSYTGRKYPFHGHGGQRRLYGGRRSKKRDEKEERFKDEIEELQRKVKAMDQGFTTQMQQIKEKIKALPQLHLARVTTRDVATITVDDTKPCGKSIFLYAIIYLFSSWHAN